MSVLSHLSDTASSAVLSSGENSSIAISVSSLQTKLNAYFVTDLSEHFKFGSYTRETILPRKLDSDSDVDYMVVFKDSSSKPQTYLDRLRRFVEAKYAKSEIRQSHPTIVLELSHIKFELVPATSFYGGYNIPAPASDYTDWMPTYPNAFNSRLTEANKLHSFNIKRLVRLVKYWNALAGHVFTPFLLEQHLVDSASYNSSLKEHVYTAFDRLSLDWSEAQWRKDRLDRAKKLINQTRDYEGNNMPATAELEIKKLIPPI